MTDQVSRATRALRRRLDADPADLRGASAPGRVNLIGGHTDYNDGFVLPIAIDRRTAVVGRPRDDGTVRAHALDFDAAASAPVEALEPGDGPRWFDYVAGVVDCLRNHGHAVGGVDLAIAGKVPMGAGVASSAALAVATAGALGEIHRLDVADRELAAVAHEAETEFVGVGCGIMDQFASTFSEAASALFLDCRAESFERIPIAMTDVSVLITDTGIQHELVDSAYNERVRQCAEGAETLDGRLDGSVDSLRDVSPAAFEAHADGLDATVRKRCRHVISENERVRNAVQALRAGDAVWLGDLMRAGHESLRTVEDVSPWRSGRPRSVSSRFDGPKESELGGRRELPHPARARALAGGGDSCFRDTLFHGCSAWADHPRRERSLRRRGFGVSHSYLMVTADMAVAHLLVGVLSGGHEWCHHSSNLRVALS